MVSRSMRRSVVVSVPIVRTTRLCSIVANTGLNTEGLISPASLPVTDEYFAEAEGDADLARDCHDDQIAPVGVIGITGYDHSRPSLRARLVGEWERHQHHIAE